MDTNEIERRVKDFQLATARLNAKGERLEAKIEQLTRERDRLKAELAAIQTEHPSKVET